MVGSGCNERGDIKHEKHGAAYVHMGAGAAALVRLQISIEFAASLRRVT